MTRWFRWYRGTTENPKFRLAARNGGVTLITVMAVWQCVLEDAANEKHRGVCEKKEDFIAATLDLSDDGQVENALRGLEYVGLIAIDPLHIIVRNWQEWQYEHDVSDPTNAERQKRHRDRKRAQSETSRSNAVTVTANNTPESDTDTEERKKPSVSKESRKTKLPDDFEPDAAAAEAYWRKQNRPDLKPAEEIPKFRAHHKAHGSVMADWGAAWQTWYVNAVKFNKPTKPPDGTQYATGFQ